MNNIEDIFKIIDGIFPSEAVKTVMFCEIENKSYEVFFYSYFEDGSSKQCYELEDEGKINSEVLEQGFAEIALYIRNCKEYNSEKRNVVTIITDGANANVEIKQFDKSMGLYKIKKEWKNNNL